MGHQITITDAEFAGVYFVDDITGSKANSDWMSVSFTCTQNVEALVTTTTA